MLTALGCLFTVFGVILLFDRGLLAIGNVRSCNVIAFGLFMHAPPSTRSHAATFTVARVQVLFLIGVTLVIGFQKTLRFFFQRRKLQGSIPFLGGIFLVLCGWTFIGMVVETFGFVNLFGYVFRDVP